MQTRFAFGIRLAALSLLIASSAAAAPPPTLLYALRNGYGVPEENRLDTVDAATAEIIDSVQVTTAGFIVTHSNGLARRPSDGALFAILRVANTADGAFIDMLATVNPATGVASVIGDMGDNFAGLAFLPSGKLYGVTGDGGNATFETLFEINPATAHPTELFRLGHGGRGETIAPAPNGRLLHASGGHNQQQTLEFVNLDSGAGITDLLLSHTFGFDNEPNALAWNAQAGTMYIVTGLDEIYTISLANGAVTFVCAAEPFRIKGMAFDGATAYVMDNPTNAAPRLYTLDLSTGAPLTGVLVSAQGYSLTGATGLARQPGTGALFAVLRTNNGSRVLAVINPATGQANVLGGLPDLFSNISFRPNGVLYGVTGDGATDPNALYTINTSTGAATLVRYLGHGSDGEAIGFAGDNLYHASGISAGNEYFERVDLSVAVPPRYEQVLAADSHTFPFGDEVLALAWSDTLGRMFVTERQNGLDTIGTAAPALVTRVAPTGRYLKGIAFDGATLYALANEDPFDLITLDPSTGATLTSVNVSFPGFSISHLTGLARSPTNGKLYAVIDIGGGRRLATINPATAVATDIGDLADKFAGLAFRANGTLIGVTGNGAATPEALFTINPATAQTQFLLQLGNGRDGEAIAIAADGFLYHASGINAGDQYWERVNLDTLQVTNIPVPGRDYPWSEATALATRPGSPIALVADTVGNLSSIDTATGAGQFIGFFHTGMADGPAPLVMKGLLFAQAPCPGDTNGDGVVDFIDLNRVLSAFGTSTGNPNFIPGADLDGDGDVDFIDLNIILSFFGTAC